ncbi:hypothetical protein [Novosphingobium sp. Gsoil 351]|uniref:hypothetical protein n=1 Tax=Novosphingobium sp. Gsoil 351 TaxID=2675225 RepID=UPI00351B5BB1
MGTGSSLLPENSNVARTQTVSVTRTLDTLTGEAMPGAEAIFLTLDVQGAELMILAGAEDRPGAADEGSGEGESSATPGDL